MSSNVQFSGNAQAALDHALKSLQTGESTRPAMQAIGYDAETVIKEKYVPVDTNNLRNHITSRVDDDGKGFVVGAFKLEYAAKNEFDEELNHDTEDNDTGERGAHYVERGTNDALLRAPATLAKITPRTFGEGT